MKNLIKKMSLVSLTGLVTTSAFAAGPDLSTLSAAADFGSAGIAILAVGAAVVGVLVIIKAVQFVKRAF